MERKTCQRQLVGGETGSKIPNLLLERQPKVNTAGGETRGREDIVQFEQVCWVH